MIVCQFKIANSYLRTERARETSGAHQATSRMAEGDGTSRNFRSSYYEKLGFCGNEEKNILDLLIASSPFDSEMLSDLSERFDLDRKCVEAWKVLLGVESNRKNPFDDFANVKQVRAEHFQSLKHHVEVLLRHNLVIRDRLKECSNPKPLDNYKHSQENSNNPVAQIVGGNLEPPDLENNKVKDEQGNLAEVCNNKDFDHTLENLNIAKKGTREGTASIERMLDNIEAYPNAQITLMYLLDVGRLESGDIASQLNSTYCRKLSTMASFFVNVTTDLQEAFFLFRNFTKKLDESEAHILSQSVQNKT